MIIKTRNHHRQQQQQQQSNAELTALLQVRLEGAGVDKITVVDDGKGISPDDAPLMAAHACTSKIESTADLDRLGTLGFRGEALHSLCAVADVTITTATADTDVGMMYTLGKGGEITSSKPAVIDGTGTVVAAANIFTGIPVRRRLYDKLDTRKAEVSSIQELLYQYAIAYPEVRFALKCSPQPPVNWVKAKAVDHRQALSVILGSQIISALWPVNVSEGGARLTGFLPSPTSNLRLVSRSANDRCYMFVNKRPVTIKAVQKALRNIPGMDADSVMKQRYPIACLFFELPADSYDVNVEPDKTVLLFHDEDLLIRLANSAIDSVRGDGTTRSDAGSSPLDTSGSGSRWTSPTTRPSPPFMSIINADEPRRTSLTPPSQPKLEDDPQQASAPLPRSGSSTTSSSFECRQPTPPTRTNDSQNMPQQTPLISQSALQAQSPIQPAWFEIGVRFSFNQ